MSDPKNWPSTVNPINTASLLVQDWDREWLVECSHEAMHDLVYKVASIITCTWAESVRDERNRVTAEHKAIGVSPPDYDGQLSRARSHIASIRNALGAKEGDDLVRVIEAWRAKMRGMELQLKPLLEVPQQ